MPTNNYQLMKRVSYIANGFLTFCVIGLMLVYNYFSIDLMVYLSIPVLALYVLFFFLIKVNKIDLYFWIVYATIGIYMCIATICLGVNFGFNLYCMSLIPIGFFCQYLAQKINARFTKTRYASFALIILYFISVGIALYNGPIYELDKIAEMIFFISNSLFVFVFLIAYSRLLVNLVTTSEKKLEHMALYDHLTGLYNRHCLMNNLREMEAEKNISWISIVDVDKFKSINDNYGHNAGDEVLRRISKLMLEVCPDCQIGRWGGEEFIIVPCNSSIGEDRIELLRSKVENTEIEFEDAKIKVTISAGASYYAKSNDLEKCILLADKCLYASKNNGRNLVTWDK